MFNNEDNISALLEQLGGRLKAARLARNESQELFAQRLGLTRQSYSRMEQGAGQTMLVNWLQASSVLGRLDDWQELLVEKQDLFTRFEQLKSPRQRAGGKRKASK
jgi:transcriptional regulator with XRE-family HTH domain